MFRRRKIIFRCGQEHVWTDVLCFRPALSFGISAFFFFKGVAQLMVQIMWDLREGIWRMIWDLQTHAVVLHLDLPTSGGIPHG